MGWISLSLRKQSLRRAINDGEMQDIALSRQLRSYQRQAHFEQTIFGNQKTRELRAAKEPLDELREQRKELAGEDGTIDYNSDEYKAWKESYDEAKEQYEAEKLEINENYDDIMNEMEEESQDEETRITTEQDQIQTELENMRLELQNISEAITKDIQDTAVKLS